MSKKVRLTWINEDLTFVEECFLIEETDPIYPDIPEKDIPPLPQSFLMNEASRKNMVIFEDETGIFFLKTSQIVEIESL